MIPRNAGQVLEKHVTLEVEAIDRLYLNADQPLLQMPGGVVRFLKQRRGAQAHGIEKVRFTKKQRKDHVTLERLRAFQAPEGVVIIGVAREKFSALRMRKRVNPLAPCRRVPKHGPQNPLARWQNPQ